MQFKTGDKLEINAGKNSIVEVLAVFPPDQGTIIRSQGEAFYKVTIDGNIIVIGENILAGMFKKKEVKIEIPVKPTEKEKSEIKKEVKKEIKRAVKK